MLGWGVVPKVKGAGQGAGGGEGAVLFRMNSINPFADIFAHFDYGMCAITDKKLPRTALSVAVGASSLLLHTLKKAKKPSRQCDELSRRARGSCSEVWTLRVAIK